LSTSTDFENYDRTSVVYDETRVSVGIEVILGHLALRGARLASQTVLDAGCGTGNYIAALRDHVGKIVGVERNPGMLAEARRKLGREVDLRQGTITELPVEDATVDAVICNQVIHHLDQPIGDSDDPGNFPQVGRAIAEVHRVLSPGGFLLLNTCSRAQLTDGFWWADLIPEAMSRVALRYPPLDSLRALMRTAGFETTGDYVPVDAVLQGKRYLDPSGPLSEQWRAGDSTWALATAEELRRAEQRVRKYLSESAMDAYMADREALRKRVGQTTIVIGCKTVRGAASSHR